MSTTSKPVSFFCLLLSVISLCGTVTFAADSPSPTLQHATGFGAGRVSSSVTPALHPARLLGAPYSAEFNLIYHILGIGNGFPNYTVSGGPPDATLAVGGSEVVQAVTASYADFDKSTGAIIPLNGQDSTLGNTIWHELLPGTLCANNNDGPLLVKFDRAAQRWIVTQNVFESPYAACVAVSQTPTFSDNLWYAYQFPVVQSGFPNSPFVAVWATGGPSDGYFETWNNFGPGGSGFVGAVMCGYHRAKMLAGDGTAEQICFQLSENDTYLLPADLDSPVGPPATEDEFFIGGVDAVDNSHLSLYSMEIDDWASGSATMTGSNNSQLIAVEPYTGACNGQFGGDCIQQGSGGDLPSFGGQLMYRFAYWDDRPTATVTAAPPIPPPLQHWLVNFAVETPTGQVGPRWFEFTGSHRTIPVTSLNVFQEGTYAGSPADTQYRWMGSIARDNAEDILLGYSESSTATNPAVYAAGRKYTDTLGTLSAEVLSVSGSPASPSEWGSYSTMEIDPSDNCTFFFTTEYYIASGFAWSTDISSWKFPNCH